MMNDFQPGQPLQSVQFRVRHTLDEIEEFAFREPAKAAAAAFGVGLLLKLLPGRALLGAAAAVGVTFMRPALLSLGVYKAVKFCCQNSKTQPQL
jgi:hypothetical protein